VVFQERAKLQHPEASPSLPALPMRPAFH